VVQRRVAASGSARSVIAFAMRQLGDPYVYGAAGPDSWDCSGLTAAAYARAGVSLPHRAAMQSTRGYAVPRSQARAGDLVLWGGVGSAYHVGIYLGGGMVLHSPRPGKTVRAAPLWGSPRFRRLV
jgi:cell wall-associated NlpC family hydrolase